MKMILPILCFIVISSCKNSAINNGCYLSLTTVRDVTDHHALLPDANATLSLFDFANNKDRAASYRYTEITDKLLLPSTDLILPDIATGEKKNKDDTPMYREKTILKFMDTLRKTLAIPVEQKDSLTTLNHSECFKTITRELALLTQQQSLHKVLWIFSNLQENSSILSVFSSSTKKLLNTNADSIQSLFEKTGLLPQNLNQIIVVFSYLPQDRGDDQRFNVMMQVYKGLLEKRGATVIVQATNKPVAL
jgi:predicted AAA+ superfamily ATPase